MSDARFRGDADRYSCEVHYRVTTRVTCTSLKTLQYYVPTIDTTSPVINTLSLAHFRCIQSDANKQRVLGQECALQMASSRGEETTVLTDMSNHIKAPRDEAEGKSGWRPSGHFSRLLLSHTPFLFLAEACSYERHKRNAYLRV